MDEKKCYIPVVCKDCIAGPDVLFEGTADTVGRTYDLTCPIVDYKLIVAEVCWRYKELNRFGKLYFDVIFPEIAEGISGIEGGPVYGMYVNPALINNKLYRVGASFIFKSANSFYIDGIEEGTPGPLKVYISKIYGLK